MSGGCGSARTTAFSREMRRRLSQSRREQRPPTSGRRPTGGSCCLIFLLIVVAVVIYAFLEAYVFGPRRNEGLQSFVRPAIKVVVPECTVGEWTASKVLLKDRQGRFCVYSLKNLHKICVNGNLLAEFCRQIDESVVTRRDLLAL